MRDSTVLVVLGCCFPASLHSHESQNKIFILSCPTRESEISDFLLKAKLAFAGEFHAQDEEDRIQVPFFRIFSGRVVWEVAIHKNANPVASREERNKGPPVDWVYSCLECPRKLWFSLVPSALLGHSFLFIPEIASSTLVQLRFLLQKFEVKFSLSQICFHRDCEVLESNQKVQYK